MTALEKCLDLLRDGTLAIDDFGQVWRKAMIVHGLVKSIEPRRAENVGGKGYLRISVSVNGRVNCVMAHRLIWIWLNGPIADGLQINHIDGNKQNNNPVNLELATPLENTRHARTVLRKNTSEFLPWAKATIWHGKPRVTEAQKAEIIRLRASGMTLTRIADAMSLSTTHVHRIIQSHV